MSFDEVAQVDAQVTAGVLPRYVALAPKIAKRLHLPQHDGIPGLLQIFLPLEGTRASMTTIDPHQLLRGRPHRGIHRNQCQQEHAEGSKHEQ